MYKPKILFYIFLIFIYFKGYSQEKKIEASFTYKGKKAEGVKYYLVDKDKAYLLSYKESKIEIPDTISTKSINILVVHKKNQFHVPDFKYKEAYYLKTYFDNRLINNRVNKEFGGYSKLKYLFRCRYLIEDGLGYVTIVLKNKKIYELIP